MTVEEMGRIHALEQTQECYRDETEATKAAARQDFFAVLDLAPKEVPVLLKHMREGKINGSFYSSSGQFAQGCCCLLGTLAEAKAGHPLDDDDYSKQIENLLRPTNGDSPAEMWFSNIEPGDTPKENPYLEDAVGWAEEWLEEKRP